jgi:hypothetical protein
MLKKRLEEGTIEDLSKKAGLEREKQIREDEEWIKKNMAPRSFYHAKRQDCKDYDKTVRHVMDVEMGKEFQMRASRLKNLLRARSAANSRMAGTVEDPANSSIEYLRE